MNSVLKKLIEANTNTGKILNTNIELPLREYLKLIVATCKTTSSPNRYLQTLLDVLKSKLREKYGTEVASEAINQFTKVPIVQMADGAHLLYDEEVFMSNFLYQIASRENHLKYLFTQQCSTIRALMYPAKNYGSVFLHLDSDIYKVFDKSRKVLTSSNIASLQDVKMVFAPLGIKTPAYANIELPDVLKGLKGSSYKNASEAILASNKVIWKSFEMKAKKRLLQFHEDLSCDVIAASIETDTALDILFFNDEVRNYFLNVKKGLIKSPKNLILKDSTDFFYYNDGRSLVPVRIVNNGENPFITNARTGAKIPVDFSKDAIIKALRDRTLYPDLFMSYMALIILPCAVAFGGASQQEYLPIIKECLIKTNEKYGLIDKTTLVAIIEQDNSRLITGLVELTPQQKRVIGTLSAYTDLNQFENTFINKTLDESIGSMRYYKYFEIFYERRNIKFYEQI